MLKPAPGAGSASSLTSLTMWDLHAFSPLDFAALLFFVASWAGYSFAVQRRRGTEPSAISEVEAKKAVPF
jgi:hypothetical protein